jgi:CHAD domain-containing protein
MKNAVPRELGLEGGEVPRRSGNAPVDAEAFTTYYDTSDRGLLHTGITLRHRVEDGSGAWQVELPTDEGRIAVEEPGEAGIPPESIRTLLAAVLRRKDIEPIAPMRAQRRGGRMRVPEPERPKRRAPALDHLRAMIAAQVQVILRNDPVVRLREDADAVHDMRVAVRRLRSILRTARVMLDDEWVEHVRAELDWLAGKLGAVRDLDVLTEGLGADGARLDGGDATVASVLLHPLREERGRARERLLAALEKRRYFALLDMLDAATTTLPATRVDVTLKKLARKELRKLRRRARRLDRPDDAALHKLRIQGKRARYAAELAQPAGGRNAAPFISAAKDLQDTLGEHQDAVVALRQLRELARRTDRTDAALVAGRLIERQRDRRARARRRLPEVWRRARRRGKRAWG